MDSEGYLPISLIASFHRVQALTQDITLVIQALQQSEVLQLKDSIKVSLVVHTHWTTCFVFNSVFQQVFLFVIYRFAQTRMQRSGLFCLKRRDSQLALRPLLRL